MRHRLRGLSGCLRVVHRCEANGADADQRHELDGRDRADDEGRGTPRKRRLDLLGMLRKLGDRLGVIELSPDSQPSAPVKVQTRTITLTELITTIQITEVQELAELPAELSVLRGAGDGRVPADAR